jgi:hypothetical protein
MSVGGPAASGNNIRHKHEVRRPVTRERIPNLSPTANMIKEARNAAMVYHTRKAMMSYGSYMALNWQLCTAKPCSSFSNGRYVVQNGAYLNSLEEQALATRRVRHWAQGVGVLGQMDTKGH